MTTLVDPRGQPISAVDAGGTNTTQGQVRGPRLSNVRSGMGGSTDKDLGYAFIARRLEREVAETLYQMSWACAKGIDIPVDDMFWKGRTHKGEDEKAIEAMVKAEEDLKVESALANAMKAGRIFGSALLIVCTDDDDYSQPFSPDDIDEGGISNLWVVDRWACSVQTWQTDPRYPRYGQPYQYRVSGRIFGSPSPLIIPGQAGAYEQATTTQNLLVNADRIFRFDGRRSPLTEGWVSGPWEREWGVSELTAAVDEVLRDAGIHAGIGHLVQEASIWVQKVHDFKEAIKGRPDRNAPTVEEIIEETGYLKSIYRSFVIDAEDDAERVGVTFAGLPQIMDRQFERLAAIFDIPKTRFLAASPAGMNATGKSDADNYALRVAAMQRKILDPVMSRLDMMLARHAGIEEAPEYQWVKLTELSESERSEITHRHTEAVKLAFDSGLIDEDEARERLSQDEYWGELGPWAGPSAHELLEMEREEQARQDRERALASRNGGMNGSPARAGSPAA